MGIPVQIRQSYNKSFIVGMCICASLLFFFGLSARAERPDSIKLDELTVQAAERPVRILKGGNLKVSLPNLMRGSRVLGEADLLNTLKRSGGISSVGDYGSGLIIQGNNPGNTIFRIDGAPVFFPYRFGGIFSTFNSGHFSSATLIQSGRNASSPSRLGAVIELSPALDYRRKIGGSVNIGLLSSALTVGTSFANKFAITASGRVSYIDQLYGRWLKRDANAVAYRFYDLNVASGWRIDSINTLKVNYFHNGDDLADDNSRYLLSTGLRWHNNVGSLRWHGRSADAGIYMSEFSGNLNVDMPQYRVSSRSRIVVYGASGKSQVIGSDKFAVEAGGEFELMDITPLWVNMEGDVASTHNRQPGRMHWQLRAFADSRMHLSRSLTLNAGLSASTFNGSFFAVDPRLSVDWRWRGNLFTFGVGVFSQYIHFVGFSELGLASNFWCGSEGKVRPQRSVDITAGWQRTFFDGQLSVSALVYGKRVISEAEYNGQIFDILNSAYDTRLNLTTSNGYNCGMSLSVQKHYGHFTATVSYSYGYAARRDGSRWVRALTDVGHQLKVDAAYEINRHWSVGAGFTFASGRVYTPTRYLYIIAGQILTEYGERNSARMPSYQRLDVSATYSVGHHSVNFGVINAYGHRNIEMQYFGVDVETGQDKLFRESSLYRFLPSISYTFEF